MNFGQALSVKFAPMLLSKGVGKAPVSCAENSSVELAIPTSEGLGSVDEEAVVVSDVSLA